MVTFHGYTQGMKTAVSVPDEVFREAEQYARRTGKTRSQVYSHALRQYLLQHAPDEVTRAWDEVCDKVDQREDAFAQKASRRLLRREAW
jgi:predicted transcriptional regulator